METQSKQIVLIEANIQATIDKVWDYFTLPEHIIQWNSASDDWCTPKAENDLREGGTFTYRMEAKDGSMGFDFGGVYDKVIFLEIIDYTLGDGRIVNIQFTTDGTSTHITKTFEPESVNPIEMQKGGWQSILNKFKDYVENH